jgi:hypothetical protein
MKRHKSQAAVMPYKTRKFHIDLPIMKSALLGINNTSSTVSGLSHESFSWKSVSFTLRSFPKTVVNSDAFGQ